MKYESFSVHYYINLRKYRPTCQTFATSVGHFFELNLVLPLFPLVFTPVKLGKSSTLASVTQNEQTAKKL